MIAIARPPAKVASDLDHVLFVKFFPLNTLKIILKPEARKSAGLFHKVEGC